MITVRAHFDGKALVPDEPVDLPRHEPLVLYVERVGGEAPTLPQASADEWLASNPVDDPSLPSDGARQHDHYLYGTPRKP